MSLDRAFSMACAWAVAAALLSWPTLPGRWRRSLALCAGLTGVAFLGLAVVAVVGRRRDGRAFPPGEATEGDPMLRG